MERGARYSGIRIGQWFMLHSTDEEVIKRYLLGDSTTDEQAEIENRLFADSTFLDRLLIIENELIHDYVMGTLSPGERAQVERFFLQSPDRQRRLRVGQLLREPAARAREESTVVAARARWTQYWRWLFLNPRVALTVAVVILATGLLWLLRDMQVLKKQVADLGRQREQEKHTTEAWAQLAVENQELRKRIQETQQEVDSLKSLMKVRDRTSPRDTTKQPDGGSGSGEKLIAMAKPVELWPGQRMGAAGTNRVRIEPGSTEVLLQLNLEEDAYRTYGVQLRDADNNQLWSADGLRTQRSRGARALIVKIPVRVLTAGDYVLTVRGNRTATQSVRVDSYEFRVEKN